MSEWDDNDGRLTRFQMLLRNPIIYVGVWLTLKKMEIAKYFDDNK